MEKTRFTETQIVKAIKEHENGRNAQELCSELGISTAAFYKWRQRYGGMEVKELKKLKELEEEPPRSSRYVISKPYRRFCEPYLKTVLSSPE